MKCWKCNQRETPLGQMFCDECRGMRTESVEPEPGEKKKRRSPDPFTYLFLCEVCGVEVYRREHVRIRTQRLLKDIRERSRLALYQHAMRVQHHKSRLLEIHINERFGDDGFEVKATEEKCPAHAQASTVLRGLINREQEEK